MLVLILGLLAGAAPLAAQMETGFSLGLPAKGANPHLSTLSFNGKVGVALPPVPHAVVFWNLADLAFDRLQQHNGASLATGLEVWISPALHPALSHGPLLLAEAEAGRRWGTGLHGFTDLGIGVGWSLGDKVPFVEYRRREGFHAGRVIDDQIVFGVHLIVFG